MLHTILRTIVVLRWIYKPSIFNTFFQISKSFTREVTYFYLFVAKLKEMRCPSESTENLTSWLKVFISSSVYMTIDPGTSSVVASSSCSVELLLDIFWAVFTGFSRFLVVVCERSFFMPLQEFVVHFKTGKNLWLTLKNAFVRFWLFKRWQTCLVFFRDASLVLLGKNCRLAFFPRLCHFVFFFNTFSRNFECEVFPQIF